MVDYLLDIITVFHKGGLVMYPLLACSVLSIAIGIERYSAFRAAEPARLYTAELTAALNDNQWEEALQLSERDSGPVPAAVVKAIQYQRRGSSCQNQLDNAAGAIAAHLKNRLHYLDTVVTVSPLLGLLGTVIGMIHSFNVIDVSGQPHAITGGIGEALIATAFGLCVAVLALMIHSYYTQRLDRLVCLMEQCFNALLEASDRSEAKCG